MHGHRISSRTAGSGIGTLRLGNKRSYSEYKPEPWEKIVNIDRPNVLGNVYVPGQGLSRDECIALYREDLEREMKRRSGPRYQAIMNIIEQVLGGQDVILMCWCRPLPCHGDVVKEIVERLMKP